MSIKIIITILISVVIFSFLKFNPNITNQNQLFPLSTPLISSDDEVHVHAEFEIVTNGTTRIFTDKKYHELSEDVRIEASDSNTVHVHKKGITWNDFFKTLPMSLDKKCLVTGTKQTFCTGNGKVLRFYINTIESPDILDLEIKNGDKLLVTFN